MTRIFIILGAIGIIAVTLAGIVMKRATAPSATSTESKPVTKSPTGTSPRTPSATAPSTPAIPKQVSQPPASNTLLAGWYSYLAACRATFPRPIMDTSSSKGGRAVYCDEATQVSLDIETSPDRSLVAISSASEIVVTSEISVLGFYNVNNKSYRAITGTAGEIMNLRWSADSTLLAAIILSGQSSYLLVVNRLGNVLINSKSTGKSIAGYGESVRLVWSGSNLQIIVQDQVAAYQETNPRWIWNATSGLRSSP